MGMFGDLMNKIFHTAGVAERPADAWKPVAPGTKPAGPIVGAAAAVAERVDVTTVLDGLAAKSSERLDWKHSIVDLMKLVGMDSSLSARRALAADLHYTGDTQDTATMNLWLHKQVMQQLAEHGGKIPADLLKK